MAAIRKQSLIYRLWHWYAHFLMHFQIEMKESHKDSSLMRWIKFLPAVPFMSFDGDILLMYETDFGLHRMLQTESLWDISGQKEKKNSVTKGFEIKCARPSGLCVLCLIES